MKKQIFIGCEVNQHWKCVHEFMFHDVVYTCDCKCHAEKFTERSIVRFAQRLGRMDFNLPAPAIIASEARQLQGRVYSHILISEGVTRENDESGNTILSPFIN